MKLSVTIYLLVAIGAMLTGCYYDKPQPIPPAGTGTASTRIEFDIRGMKTDFTKLDVAVLLKDKRLATGKVEDEKLVLAYNHPSSLGRKELMLEISRDGKTLLKKVLDSVRTADVRSLDQNSP